MKKYDLGSTTHHLKEINLEDAKEKGFNKIYLDGNTVCLSLNMLERFCNKKLHPMIGAVVMRRIKRLLESEFNVKILEE